MPCLCTMCHGHKTSTDAGNDDLVKSRGLVVARNVNKRHRILKGSHVVCGELDSDVPCAVYPDGAGRVNNGTVAHRSCNSHARSQIENFDGRVQSWWNVCQMVAQPSIALKEGLTQGRGGVCL